MGNELVSGSLTPQGGEQNGSAAFSCSDFFLEHLPYYLSIGMPYDLYWSGDCALVRSYRKAFQLRQRVKNQDLWLQGAYFYEAICDASPLFNPFAKPGTNAFPYISSPYGLTEEDIKEEKERQEKAKYEKMKEKTLAWASSMNERFALREEGLDGRTD